MSMTFTEYNQEINKLKNSMQEMITGIKPKGIGTSSANGIIERFFPDIVECWYDIHYDRNIMYGIKVGRRSIVKSVDGGDNWEEVWEKPWPGEPWLHKGITTKSGYHYIWTNPAGNVYRVAPDWSSYEIVMTADNIMYPPFSNDLGVAEKDGMIFIAEYWNQAHKIWKSEDDGLTWNVVLDDAEVFHYHSVQVDPYTGHLWACAGDVGEEVKIFKSTNDGETWSVVATGSQDYRSCGLVFFKDFILWATDGNAVSYQNKIFKTGKDVWDPVEVGEIESPSFGNFRARDGRAYIQTLGELREYSIIYMTDGTNIKELIRIYGNPESSETHKGFIRVTKPDKDNRIMFRVINSSIGHDTCGTMLLPFSYV